MIVTEETTVVFQLPQDYQLEQEFLAEASDEWQKVGEDTQGTYYRRRRTYTVEKGTERRE